MDDLVERLKPRWAVDEKITRAAADRDFGMREIVTEYLVATNALKSEAVAALETQQSHIDRLREALKPFAELADVFAATGASKIGGPDMGKALNAARAALSDGGE